MVRQIRGQTYLTVKQHYDDMVSATSFKEIKNYIVLRLITETSHPAYLGLLLSSSAEHPVLTGHCTATRLWQVQGVRQD